MIPAIHDSMPEEYSQLLGLDGVGPSTVRSLALVAEIIFGAPVSLRDPAASSDQRAPYCESTPPENAGTRRWADYSFAHGGKDGTPFPVDRETYDLNVHKLTEAIRRARIGEPDRMHALKRLSRIAAG